jgi:hypothetical protein
MANDIWSKKELTEAVQMITEHITKLNEQFIRTTKLISMMFDSLPEESKQQILTELIKADKEEETKEEEEDGEGDAV